MLMQAELQVELLQERPVDSEWPVTAMRSEHAGVEAVTEEAKWSAADIRGVQTSRKVSSQTVEPEVPTTSRCEIQSTWAQLPQERLRSSWVPTSILLYSFCCSSLKVSFTLARFSPPSLQKIGKGVTLRWSFTADTLLWDSWAACLSYMSLLRMHNMGGSVFYVYLIKKRAQHSSLDYTNRKLD